VPRYRKIISRATIDRGMWLSLENDIPRIFSKRLSRKVRVKALDREAAGNVDGKIEIVPDVTGICDGG
jgi:hypothetical protein